MTLITEHASLLVFLASVVLALAVIAAGALRLFGTVKRFKARLDGYAALPLSTEIALAQSRVGVAARRAGDLPLVAARAEAAFAAIALARTQIVERLGNRDVWLRIGIAILTS